MTHIKQEPRKRLSFLSKKGGGFIIKTYETAQVLTVDKDLVPYNFTYDYKGRIFEIELNYNGVSDYFSASLYLLDGEEKLPLVLSEKIMINQPLFIRKTYLNIDIPVFMPCDFADVSKRAGYEDNFYLAVM